jgi:mannose-6-phosphate isomerase-like protein (cupin superfamily)
VVLEGRGTFRVGDEERNLGTQTAVLAPAGLEHGVVNPGPGRLILLVFMAPQPKH